jgi:SAM-dependent methyltransferase
MKTPQLIRRFVESSAERGVLARVLQQLPSDRGARVRRRLRRFVRPARLGTLRSPIPLSDDFGWDRGSPVDRYYIERFLAANRRDIRGRVLEVKDRTYTKQFGTGVDAEEVLDVDPTNPQATIVADLADADEIPEASFDCVILTQTLQFIYDVRSAIAHVYRVLKPGGVVLATMPAISPIVDDDELPYYWRFTAASSVALFGDVFGHGSVRVREYGNVLAAIAFLSGMAYEELTRQELEAHDRRFTVVVSVRAVKQDGAGRSAHAGGAPRDV